MMTADNEKATITVGGSTAVNVGEKTKFEPVPQEAPQDVHPMWHGPPPHIRKYMKRKAKRACCCLFILLLLNLFTVAYIAKKVSYISSVLEPGSDMAYMPGGTEPFCADLCVSLCVGSDKEDAPIDCDIKDCLNGCSSHFKEQEEQQDNDDDDESLTVNHQDNDDEDSHEDEGVNFEGNENESNDDSSSGPNYHDSNDDSNDNDSSEHHGTHHGNHHGNGGRHRQRSHSLRNMVSRVHNLGRPLFHRD